jgi:DNA-binding YbaB/EbfC family protein
MSPPLPPSPPHGPPSSTCASRLQATIPGPPSPAFNFILISSTNCILIKLYELWLVFKCHLYKQFFYDKFNKYYNQDMNIQELMGQAQKLQSEVQKKLDEFEKKQFEYDYKNGAVVVIIQGNMLIASIKINKTLIDPEDAQMLEEMIAEAVNQAVIGVQNDRDAIQDAVTSKSKNKSAFGF